MTSLCTKSRIRNLAVAGLLAAVCAVAISSTAAAEDYVAGQEKGLQKCVRAILGGYEVKGVSVFGHKFNCKGMSSNSRGRKFINVSHDQFGKDDQTWFGFDVNSQNVYRAGTLSYKTTKGLTIKSILSDFAGKSGGPNLDADNYRGFVKFARDLRRFRHTPNWEIVPYYIAFVAIAELGNPENRGVTPRQVDCELPTVYVHDNYSGASLRLKQPDSDLHDKGGKFGDSISSICVPRGFVVFVFEDKDFRGRMLQITGPKQFEDLKRQLKWGDRISSIKVLENTKITGRKGDKISSVKVFENTKITGRER